MTATLSPSLMIPKDRKKSNWLKSTRRNPVKLIGNRAKQELSGLAFGRSAAVQVQDIDRYGRTVGRITVDGVDVNAEMVRRGAALVSANM